MLNRRKAILDYLQGAVWVLPTFGVAIGLGSGAVLSMIPVKSGTLIDKLMFQGTPGDARGVLIVVSATMITTIGIVFSLTVLSLQIASSQFSVRLLRTFLRDVPNQVVLAIFACTFAYSTGGLHTVGEHRDGGAFIPKVAVTGSLALAFVSIAALIYFLHHLMHSIQIDTIMDKVRLRTLGLVDQLYPESDTADRQVETPPSPPADAVPLLAPHSGYLQTVDVDDIAELAAASRYTALLVTFVGDYVTAGGLLGWCWRRGTAPGAPGSDFPQRCLRHVHIGFERTLQQDIRFGLRQMVDIALRALSPALNDPYTAIQVVHHLSAVESVLASRALPDDVRRDRAGELLFWLPYPSFATYLHVGCAQIRRYGSREPLVLTALLQLLSAVAQNCVDPSRRVAVQTQIALVVRAAQREFADESDRAMVLGAAARATEVVERPGTLAPPPSTFGQHRPDPLVRFVAGQLLAARCQHGQLRLAPLVETLAVDETIRAAADFGNDLGADISVGRLDLLDFLLRRAVLVLEQQVQRLDHGGLADLVGAAHHHHSMIGEFDVTVCDAAVIGQGQPVQLHAAPRSASRSNSASAAWASTADSSSPPRAVATSSSTAAAANPPMPRSVNSASTGITARSV